MRTDGQSCLDPTLVRSVHIKLIAFCSISDKYLLVDQFQKYITHCWVYVRASMPSSSRSWYNQVKLSFALRGGLGGLSTSMSCGRKLDCIDCNNIHISQVQAIKKLRGCEFYISLSHALYALTNVICLITFYSLFQIIVIFVFK